jgi:hypothetical protein
LIWMYLVCTSFCDLIVVNMPENKPLN